MHRTVARFSSVLSQSFNCAQFVANKCYHVNFMFNLFLIFNRCLHMIYFYYSLIKNKNYHATMQYIRKEAIGKFSTNYKLNKSVSWKIKIPYNRVMWPTLCMRLSLLSLFLIWNCNKKRANDVLLIIEWMIDKVNLTFTEGLL